MEGRLGGGGVDDEEVRRWRGRGGRIRRGRNRGESWGQGELRRRPCLR